MIRMRKLDPFPPNINPYTRDGYHMGMPAASNVEVMTPAHATERTNYIIVVNKTTGERVELTFSDVNEDFLNNE